MYTYRAIQSSLDCFLPQMHKHTPFLQVPLFLLLSFASFPGPTYFIFLDCFHSMPISTDLVVFFPVVTATLRFYYQSLHQLFSNTLYGNETIRSWTIVHFLVKVCERKWRNKYLTRVHAQLLKSFILFIIVPYDK
jgi:hypothetical protein